MTVVQLADHFLTDSPTCACPPARPPTWGGDGTRKPSRSRRTDDAGRGEAAAEYGFDEQGLLARYLGEARQIPLLTPAAEAALFRDLTEGRAEARLEARARLIAANLRLVVSVAGRYVNLGLSLPDLVAEGNLGLIAAIDRFEHGRGHRFSTYAHWPIRKAIERAIDDRGRLVRLPADSWIRLRALRHAEHALTASLRRAPTSTELAHATGIAHWRLAALRRAATPLISLDGPARGPGEGGGGDARMLGDTLEGPNVPLPEIVGRGIAREQLLVLLGTLPSRARALLILRHGLDGAPPRTLKQVGALLGISGEYTRILEARTLLQLREHPLAGPLRDCLD